MLEFQPKKVRGECTIWDMCFNVKEKMDLTELRYEGFDWIKLAQYTDQ